MSPADDAAMSRRRALAGLLALALAPCVRAQPGAQARTIGYLSGGAGPEELARLLARHGHVEGKNLRFVFRRSTDDLKALDESAAELVRARPDVLVAWGHPRVAALAAATRTIPIVCGLHPDPIAVGLAQSLARPGGNVTGLSGGIPEAVALQLIALRAFLPALGRLTIVHPPGVRELAELAHALEAECAKARIEVRRAPAVSMDEVDALFASMDRETEAAYLWPLGKRIDKEIGAATLRHRVATHAWFPEMVEQGALVHCRLDWEYAHRMERVAAIIDMVLRGTPPGVIPFESPDRVTFVVNRTTALRLGMPIPVDILLRATRVVG